MAFLVHCLVNRPQGQSKNRNTCQYRVLAKKFTKDGRIIITGIEKLKTRVRPGQYIVVNTIAAHRTRTPEDRRSTEQNLHMFLERENYSTQRHPERSNLGDLAQFDLAKTPKGFSDPGRSLSIRSGANYDVFFIYSVYTPERKIRNARECIKFRYR